MAEIGAGVTTDRQWLTRLALILAVFVNNANFSATTVALPSIQRSLGLGFSGLQWVMTAYLVTYAAFMLLGGRLSDVIGVRRVLLAGVALYLVAQLIVAAAPTALVFFPGRALQGIAAALITPTTTSAARTRFSGAAQTATIGMIVGMSAVGQAVGPLLGGFLGQGIGWRAVFAVNVPLLAASAVLTLVTMAPDPPRSRQDRIDVPGAILFAASLALLTVALTEAQTYGLASLAVAGLLAGAAAALAAFAFRLRGRQGGLLDPSLLRSGTFAASTAVGFTMTFTLASILFFEALYLERVRGFGSIETGLLFLPLTALFGALSLQAARVERRFGHRTPAIIGLAIAAAGSVILALDQPGSSLLRPLGGLLLIGLGLGVSWTQVTSAGLRAVSATQAGQAAGILFTARWVGGTAGIAVLGLVYGSAADASLAGRLQRLGPALGPARGHHRYDRLDGLLSGPGHARGLLSGLPAHTSAAIASAVRDAASIGTARAAAGVAVVAGAGALLCLLFPRDPARPATRGAAPAPQRQDTPA